MYSRVKPLKGKVSLVTGSASHGIGRAMALALANAGADVVVHGHNDLMLAKQIAAQVTALGVRSSAVLADLSDPDTARRLICDAIAEMGTLDILVNNAGVALRKPLLDCTDANFSDLISVNLQSYFATSQEAARHMLARNSGGRIIMVSSINQNVVVRDQGLYCATKGGVMQLAKSFALELAGSGITVNLIAPGLIESDFNRHLLADAKFRDRAMNDLPMGRPGHPEEVAQAAVYFALPESSYVTGATITVDGGKSLP